MMQNSSASTRPFSPSVSHDPIPAPPAWVKGWLGDATPQWKLSAGIPLTIVQGPHATLVTAVLANVRFPHADVFRQRTIDLYHEIHRALQTTGHGQIVRMWNHIPGIHDRMDDGCERYMVFNAGRHAAMCDWFGGDAMIGLHVPAASGVGHEGNAFIVHALATLEPGIPLDNPRQTPAYCYSPRYGPMPPCFARAMRVNEPQRALLIAGTASITGENSMHVGDVEKQFDLTLSNLTALLQAADCADGDHPLQRIEQVRAYVPASGDRTFVAQAVQRSFPHAVETEIFEAELCRSELLVEIEGFVRLNNLT